MGTANKSDRGPGSSGPQGYCLFSWAIIQFPILLYIRLIISQRFLLETAIWRTHRWRARGSRAHPALDSESERNVWLGREPQNRYICYHLWAFSFPRPGWLNVWHCAPRGWVLNIQKIIFNIFMVFIFSEIFPSKIKNTNSGECSPPHPHPRLPCSVSMTSSFNVTSGLICISERCDCHHHNIKSYFYLSHICAAFSTNKSNRSKSTSNLIQRVLCKTVNKMSSL